jgi:hypothetical protein
MRAGGGGVSGLERTYVRRMERYAASRNDRESISYVSILLVQNLIWRERSTFDDSRYTPAFGNFETRPPLRIFGGVIYLGLLEQELDDVCAA